jgi:hypothetical protein
MSSPTSTSSSEVPLASLGSLERLPQGHVADAEVAANVAAIRLGLQRLGWVLLTLLIAAGATYAHPRLERFRPWMPGEPWPLAVLWQAGEGQSMLPEFAEAGTAIGSATPKDQGARGGDPGAKGVPAPPPVREQAPHPSSAGPAVHIDPKEYTGLAVPIEDPSGRALDAFYAALKATAERKPAAITRVAHYGDSAVAADGVASTMRRNLQQRFGDSGHGFILIARGDMHYNHRDIRHRSSDDWSIYPVMHRQLGRDWYGYGGVQFRSKGGAQASFETTEEGPIGERVSRFEIFYQHHPKGGDLRVKIDDGAPETLSTRHGTQEDAWQVFRLPDGPHRLSLQAAGRGEVRLYGVALERDVPGVVYDSLGLVGAREKRLLNADPEHMTRQVQHRRPQLLVMAFGGNTVDDRLVDVDSYKQSYAEVLDILRGGRRDMSCLLFAPLDQGQRDDRGRVVTLPNVSVLVQAQRELAFEQGCAYFDTFQAMGGEGAMGRWYKLRPRLATGDFRHATPAGYDALGQLFYKALLKGFADYLRRQS